MYLYGLFFVKWKVLKQLYLKWESRESCLTIQPFWFCFSQEQSIQESRGFELSRPTVLTIAYSYSAFWEKSW